MKFFYLGPNVLLHSQKYFYDRELKDNLGSDDPEGDMPVLLQTVLSRNPNIFREKSMPTRYGVQGGKEKTWRHCPWLWTQWSTVRGPFIFIHLPLFWRVCLIRSLKTWAFFFFSFFFFAAIITINSYVVTADGFLNILHAWLTSKDIVWLSSTVL